MRALFIASLGFVACTSVQTVTPAPPLAVSPEKPVVAAPPPPPEDPYLWLEEVDALKSLEWVKARNAVSTKELEAVPAYAALRDRLKGVFQGHIV
jgi:prolyl oligopeptidase